MGGSVPIWARNGREIFYLSSDDTWVIATVGTGLDFAVESRERFASARGFATSRLIQRFDVAPDDQRVLAIRTISGSSESRDIVIQNFFEELRQVVPE